MNLWKAHYIVILCILIFADVFAVNLNAQLIPIIAKKSMKTITEPMLYAKIFNFLNIIKEFSRS